MGLQTVPEFDQRTARTPPAAFAGDVATLEALLGQIRRRERGGAPWPRHPIFGRMSERAWLRWAYLRGSSPAPVRRLTRTTPESKPNLNDSGVERDDVERLPSRSSFRERLRSRTNCE
jgi:hypothetical protein